MVNERRYALNCIHTLQGASILKRGGKDGWMDGWMNEWMDGWMDGDSYGYFDLF